jgi:hypothetical protein
VAVDLDTRSAAAAAGAAGEAAAVPRLPWVLFAGLAVSSIGGPIALPSLLPGAAGESIDSAGLVVALSLAAFAAPLAIWWRYSQRVVSPGGLSAFVDAAAGRPAALVQGWIWAVAYFLYLPFTVTYVVYDVLPPVFPGIGPYRAALELMLPAALVLIALAPVAIVLAGVAILGASQLIVLLVLAGVVYAHVPVSFAGRPTFGAIGRGAGNTALLYFCASLPLYLGAEVRGGGRTVRRVLPATFAIVGAAFLVAAIPLAGVPDALRSAAVPGAAIAQAYGGRALAVTVGLLTAGSMLTLIVAEYLALGRLIHWLHGLPLRATLAWIGVPFVIADALSLVNPDRFYNDLLTPSLAALYVSQLLVFLVFPRFRRGALGFGLAALAVPLAGWGVYGLFASGSSS